MAKAERQARRSERSSNRSSRQSTRSSNRSSRQSDRDKKASDRKKSQAASKAKREKEARIRNKKVNKAVRDLTGQKSTPKTNRKGQEPERKSDNTIRRNATNKGRATKPGSATTNLLDFNGTIDDLFTEEGQAAIAVTPEEQDRQDRISAKRGNRDSSTGNIEELIDVAEEMEEFESFDPTGIPDSFTDINAEGLQDDSLAADIQNKYGGLASETGRRGSQAREIIGKEGDAAVQGFIGSDAYEQLKSDPTAITNTDIQAALTDIGVDWQALAYGKKSTKTGDVTYDKIDFEMLDKYLNTRINPLNFANSGDNSVLGSLVPPTSAPSAETVADIVAPADAKVPTVTDPTGRTAATTSTAKRV